MDKFNVAILKYHISGDLVGLEISTLWVSIINNSKSYMHWLNLTVILLLIDNSTSGYVQFYTFI